MSKKKLKFNPQFLFDAAGKKCGVLLKPKEFSQLIERLEDLDDALTVYQRTQGKKVIRVSAEEVWKNVPGK